MSEDNPYLRRKAQHSIGASGRASEVRLARRTKGRATPASGALEGAKGDVSFGEVLMEAKSTIKESFSLKLNWLLKIRGEAERVHKIPALSVIFCTENGTPRKEGKWVMMPEETFQKLLDAGALTTEE